ncbi:peptidylprolyl isomerase [Wenzhouxiangella sp. EGI_FJ10409]|uniref:peptidylprolyl isomerase n=1 Tax=Wenzhouxiangella sp. EGI_FJ10409 TaxID=3243767 RepID=UPI0035D645AF
MKLNYPIFMLPFLLVACGETGSGSGSADEDTVVLVEVDGTPVTLTMLERVMEARGVEESDHDGMRELLDELIRMQAVANAARQEGLADDPEVRAELRLGEMQSLYRHYLDRAGQSGSISEQDLRDVYAAQLERSGDTQYRIEIIGYEDQARALQAIQRLRDGELTVSELQAEAEAEGLRVEAPGWVDRSQVPEDFAAELAETSTGEVVSRPLQNGQGWFLVHVADKRDLQVPAFEQVRDGIAQSMQQEQRQALVESLYDQAEITPMLPLEEAEPESPEQ